MVKWKIMEEYNLRNPSVSEEERMIHDRIDAEYRARDMENEDYWKAVEDAYWKAVEDAYWKSVEEAPKLV